ncbi:MAG: hypothetical protein HOV81_11815 [Kofleriaceae bacterium]|nr:hypothetical protein [Kofleriaceae bacterium]
MKLAVALFAIAACGGSPMPAAAPPKPATKCAAVGDQLVSLMSDTAREATEEVDAMRRQIIARCEQDGWSAEAQDCFIHVSTRQEAAEKCASLLTAEQGNALMQQQQQETSPEAPAAPAAAPPETHTSDPCEGGE